LEPIAPLIDMLSSEFRDATFILFGSRAKGSAQKYSDWDVGVFSKKGISHEMYRKIVNRKEELVEDCPFFVDVVNLNQADKYFLRESAKYWMFLSGKLSDWVELQKRVKK
jgi:predicted nucleotidyltransferase